jgi:hypothetical protein
MPGRALACINFVVEGAPFRVHSGRGSNTRATCPAMLMSTSSPAPDSKKLREEVTAGPPGLCRTRPRKPRAFAEGCSRLTRKPAEAPSVFEGRGTGLLLPGPEPPAPSTRQTGRLASDQWRKERKDENETAP